MASACHLCRSVGSRLSVVWFRDRALGAPFSEIFEPVNSCLLEVRDASPLDFAVNDRPRRHNLWLPEAAQLLLYRRRIYEKEVTPLKQRGFDFEAWARGHRCYMSCYQEFGAYPDDLYRAIFRPVRAVAERVEANAARLAPYSIGMHIRRTDHGEATAKSPTRLFIDAGRRELALHPGMSIYLATDDEDVKRELRGAFGDRVITAEAPASRDSIEGIRGGLTDMYTLARTSRIYGSAGSSFSPMAARIGGVELKEVRVI